jgi:drug/metabolite transporter (DMT)-like permease
MDVVESESAFRNRSRDADPAALVYLALMVLIGSSTAPAAKFAVRELPVGMVPLIRFGVAGICLLPVVWRGGALGRLFREDGGRLAVTAALCVPINQSFFLNGARWAPTSHAALIYAACPLVVLLLASALGQERIVPRRLAGILVSIVGVVVIGLGNFWHGGSTGRATTWGDLLLVGAVSSWGMYLTASKPLIARHGALPVLAGTFLVGGAFDLPIAVASFPGWAVVSTASRAAWCGLAYLTLIVTAVGLAFQNQALRRLDASQVATAGNAAPLLTVLWGVWLFDEAITPALMLGGALTLGGILWTSRPVDRVPRRPHPQAPLVSN